MGSCFIFSRLDNFLQHAANFHMSVDSYFTKIDLRSRIP